MGADGWIPNPEKPLGIHVYCYYCSKPVKHGRPIEGHRECLKQGKLFVNIEEENYEDR